MYYLVLFLAVLSVFFFLALRLPSQPGGSALEPWPPRGKGEGAGIKDFAARFFGARTEEKPCLTPIDCVRSGRCSGNCGWR